MVPIPAPCGIGYHVGTGGSIQISTKGKERTPY